jgi:AcrR family transcriptional regulator
MAYRKTEKVLAQIEARRNSIIASAIDVIAKSGMDGLTTDAVAARAGVANGLMYKYFADRTELLATVFAKLLARDLETMRAAAGDEKDPLQAFATAMAVFYSICQSPLAPACAANPIYRRNVRDEFARLIRAAIDDLEPAGVRLASAATVGAIYAWAGSNASPQKLAPAAALFVLRGIGVSGAVARKVVARMYGYSNVPA